MRNLIIAALVVALGFTLWRLGDVERQRYLMLVGLCAAKTVPGWDVECLATEEPRTSPLWDVYNGLLP